MLKPGSREQMLNARLTNRAVLSLIHFGIVPSSWLSLSSALLGLLTLAQGRPGSLWHMDSTQVQQVQPLPYWPQGKFCKSQRALQLYFSYFPLQYTYLGNYFHDCDIYVVEDNVTFLLAQWRKKHKIWGLSSYGYILEMIHLQSLFFISSRRNPFYQTT